MNTAKIVGRAPGGERAHFEMGRRGPGNVLLVVLDDVGVEALAAYGLGPEPAPTSTFDALVNNGLLFTHAYGNPLCSPTRATIQTGRYSFRTGVGSVVKEEEGWPLQLEETTLPEVLGPLGHDHAAFGKWHLGNDSVGGLLAPNQAGYGHYRGTVRGIDVRNGEDYFHWTTTTDGIESEEVGYLTSATVDDALGWIKTRTKPWFCYVALNAAHTPFHRPPQHLHEFNLPADEPAKDEDPRPYWLATIQAADTELGRLFAGVDLSQTTIVVMGDNGSSGQVITPPFEPGQNKSTPYEGGIRCPLFMAGRGVSTPGSVVDALVQTTDVFATVIELAGGDPRSPSLPVNDSISLVPYMQDPGREGIRIHAFAERFAFDGVDVGNARRAIRNHRFKLIRFPNRFEMYDLVADPFESAPLDVRNLPPDAEIGRARLSAALDDLLASG